MHSKIVLTISSNFLDDTLCRKKIIMRDPSANGKEVKVISTISAQNIGHGQLWIIVALNVYYFTNFFLKRRFFQKSRTFSCIPRYFSMGHTMRSDTHLSVLHNVKKSEDLKFKNYVHDMKTLRFRSTVNLEYFILFSYVK